MCFHLMQKAKLKKLEERFDAVFDNPVLYEENEFVNGFSHPSTPVITNTKPESIQLFSWGLIPPWAKDAGNRSKTLNAMVETVEERVSFKPSLAKRCLVLADGFYEWRWLDKTGKHKEKYLITTSNESPFAFAGLWSEWTDPQTNQLLRTYTILTTSANELMSKIHNSKKRMPILLTKESEQLWLNENRFEINHDLRATSMEAPQIDLFSAL